MLYKDYTEELLGLKDVIVTNIINIEGHMHIYLDCKLQPQVCPHCRFATKRVHSYRNQTVSDVDFAGLNGILHIRRRRYLCTFCNKTFYEKLAFLKRYQRHTQRLMCKVINDFRAEYSIKRIAQMNNISSGIATRIFDRVSYARPNLPRVLAIDEFKGNAGRKFQCILTDPKNHKVLDILPTKKSEDIRAYFGAFPMKQRRKVKYLVMDMSLQFRGIMLSCFPNAQIITDKFHVCRYAIWAMEKIRKEVQKNLKAEDRKWFKRSRWLTNCHSYNLKGEDIDELSNMLSYSENLRTAYCLKEAFFRFMNSSDMEEAKKNLKYFQLITHITNVPEFVKLYEMVKRWEPYILRAFSMSYSNGYTEGCNNKIKVLKRNAYGVKNFKRFRNRILHMMAV